MKSKLIFCIIFAAAALMFLSSSMGFADSPPQIKRTVKPPVAQTPAPAAQTPALKETQPAKKIKEIYSIDAASIQIISPNGGEYIPDRVPENYPVRIRWNYQQMDDQDQVRIELLKNGNRVKFLYNHPIPVRIGEYGVHLKNVYNVPSGGDYRIRISTWQRSPEVSDVSDSDFTIFKPRVTLVTPNGGEKWVMGAKRQISWTISDFPPGVTPLTSITLLKGSGDHISKMNPILNRENAPNLMYEWTVGNCSEINFSVESGNDYSIYINVRADEFMVFESDKSNAHFSIIDPKSLKAPEIHDAIKIKKIIP